jgi:microcin C transport system substrate-binding protein
MNRRSLLGYTLLGVATLPFTWPRSIGAALADNKDWRHGVSLFGDLKYSAGFRHFEYVNADAPKGGTARGIAIGTFDNFNERHSSGLARVYFEGCSASNPPFGR